MSLALLPSVYQPTTGGIGKLPLHSDTPIDMMLRVETLSLNDCPVTFYFSHTCYGTTPYAITSLEVWMFSIMSNCD